EMIVWGGGSPQPPGGYVSSGARYDPGRDTWTATATGTNVPLPRASHTAVWTGSEMIVWGGQLFAALATNTGGRYDPILDRWSPTSLGPNVPPGRRSSTAVWTGSEMVVWGGADQFDFWPAVGGRYSPATDSWAPTSVGATVPLLRVVPTYV